jgi:hypothetical protein
LGFGDLHSMAVRIADYERFRRATLRGQFDDSRRDPADTLITKLRGRIGGIHVRELGLPMNKIIGFGIRWERSSIPRRQIFKELDPWPRDGAQ